MDTKRFCTFPKRTSSTHLFAVYHENCFTKFEKLSAKMRTDWCNGVGYFGDVEGSDVRNGRPNEEGH